MSNSDQWVETIEMKTRERVCRAGCVVVTYLQLWYFVGVEAEEQIVVFQVLNSRQGRLTHHVPQVAVANK